MRLFLWFSNTVRIYFHKIVHLLWHPTLQEMVGVHPDAVGFLKRIKINDFCFCIFDRLTLLKFGLRWRLLIPRTFCFVLKYLSHIDLFYDSSLPLVLTQFLGINIQGHGVWKSQKKSQSELSLYLSGQKLLKKPKMVEFGDFLKTWSLRWNGVTRQVNV